MKKINLLMVMLLMAPLYQGMAQKQYQLQGTVVNQDNEPLEDVFVYVGNQDKLSITNAQGRFSFRLPAGKAYVLMFQNINIASLKKEVLLDKNISLKVQVTENVQQLSEFVFQGEVDAFGIRQLRSIEGDGLYEGKKTEVINISKLVSNKAANNARQAFSKVPSLNIWESDNAGLQLDIGGRGLSPKRTTNFNTRQNGYDISADALGYPESYYTPPLQAVQQVEIVRGAGALQYGSQFGGLVNFKMRKGSEAKPFSFESQNTYGANQFFNTFNSFHGQYKKVNYFSYIQYKRGDGWRQNSEFEQFGAYGRVTIDLNKKLSLGFEYTHSQYLSQQAGGLTDEMFERDPRMSNRDRNWFKVNWNLAAVSLKYKASPNTTIYSRTFGLHARRTSLGLLETPDIEDPLSNRDLIDGQFRNIGNETRLIYNYELVKGLKNSMLIGTRLYSGTTNFSQGFGSAGADPDFAEVDTTFLGRRRSDFEFPNFNAAIFMENIIRLSPKFSLIPGLRYEYIDTSSEGWFTNTVRINSFGDFEERRNTDTSENQRHIFLYGLGASRQLNQNYELYANATANYRAINFTDVQIQTNTQLVDTLIRDESGFSFDLGVRRLNFSPFFIEPGVFFIAYDDRIGEVIDDGLRVRTNIGDARIFGVELFTELDLMKLLKRESAHKVSLFVNGSVNRGTYTSINSRALRGVRTGNRLEDIPDYNIKSGIGYGYKKFTASVQSTFVGKQFSDAANTEDPFVGVFGPIPSYFVMDFSARYAVNEHFEISSSINNVLNRYYFTRRATAYPGPGIIPALGRIWNVTMSVKW